MAAHPPAITVEALQPRQWAILAAIRRHRYDVWSRRPTVGRLTKLRLLLSAWYSG